MEDDVCEDSTAAAQSAQRQAPMASETVNEKAPERQQEQDNESSGDETASLIEPARAAAKTKGAGSRVGLSGVSPTEPATFSLTKGTIVNEQNATDNVTITDAVDVDAVAHEDAYGAVV